MQEQNQARQLEVELIAITPDAQKVIELAGRSG